MIPMDSISRKIDNFVQFLEKDRLSIFGIFLWVLLVSILRGYLEPVLHFGYFEFGLFANDVFTGVSSFVGACLVVSYFSKTSYKKVMNVAAFGWLIILLPPLFDFFAFGTLETGSWSYARIEDIRSPIDFIFPLFVLRAGFSVGLVLQTAIIYISLTLYVLWKSKSIKNAIIFSPSIFIFAFIESFPAFFFYIISSFILELKLLPGAYQWYIFIFVFWSFLVLLLNSKFRKDFYPVFKIPFILGVIICSLGGILSTTRFLDSFDLFLRICISVFLLTSFSIYINTKIPYKNLKTFIISVFSDKLKKDRKFRIFEIALCLQIISIVIAFSNSYLKMNQAFLILTLLGVIIINLQVFLGNLKNRKYLYSVLIAFSFFLGYSLNYNNFFDILNRIWVLFITIFIISLIIIHFSKK